MSKSIVVLGAGMVGKAMAIDLSKQFDTTSVDVNQAALEQLSSAFPINTIQADLSDVDVIKEIVKPFDLVIGAVPGFMGFNMFKAVIEAGKNIVDISFFPEDPMVLDNMAKSNGVVAIMDAGVAPGMDNIILGYHDQHMDIERFECLVGGLPKHPRPPFNYKAPFSPIDVIEEYTRPARYRENGELVIKEALTDIVPISFPDTGELESFNSDGLRSLLTSFPAIPNMIEKTLRFPGHAFLMKQFRDTGLFSTEAIDVNGNLVQPIDLTSQLLFKHWKLAAEEEEFTVMRVEVEGSGNGSPKCYSYYLYDVYDTRSKTSSMARTTGYTCSAIANLVLDGSYDQVGVSPAEYVGGHGNCFQKILEYLKDRNINYHVTTK